MDLKSILLPSHSVEVYVFVRDDFRKMRTLILKTIIETGYTDGFLKIIAPIYHGKVYNFQINESIELSFALPNQEHKDIFSINCKVLSKHVSNNMSILTLKVTSQPKKIQRRQSFRVNILNTYSFLYKGVSQEIVTKDISSTGMLALSTIQLNPHDVFEIIFNSNVISKDGLENEYSDLKVFRLRCKVIDSMPQTEIRRYLNRIQFENMSSAESKYLLQYLYAKQTEIIHLDPNENNKVLQYFEADVNDQRSYFDPIQNRIQIMGLINIFILFFAFVMLLYAQPTPLYGLDRFFGYYRPMVWNTHYLLGSILMASLTVVIGIVGLVINASRLKRNNDSLSKSLLITLIISLLLLVLITYFTISGNLQLLS